MPVTQHNARDLLIEAIERVLLDQEPTARKYRRWLQRITDDQGFLDIQLLLPEQEITKATQGVYLRYGEHLADLLSKAPEMPRSRLSLAAFHDAHRSIPARPNRYSSYYNPLDQLHQAEMQKLASELKGAFYADSSQAGARIRLIDPTSSLSSQTEMLNACRRALALLTLAAEFAAGSALGADRARTPHAQLQVPGSASSRSSGSRRPIRHGRRVRGAPGAPARVSGMQADGEPASSTALLASVIATSKRECPRATRRPSAGGVFRGRWSRTRPAFNGSPSFGEHKIDREAGIGLCRARLAAEAESPQVA